MIYLENGHWRSSKTDPEERASVTNKLTRLDPDTRAAVLAMLSEYDATGASHIADTAASALWEITPVPIDEWLDDPDLSGESAGYLFPNLKEDMCELFREPFFSGRYSEVILTGALGVGKTYFMSICLTRICYELLCLKSPQVAFGLSPSDPLYIVPISRTKELARRVAFGQIAGKLNLSPFFRARMRETKEEVCFPDKRLYIIGGASNESHTLGMSTIAVAIDESNFFGKGSVSKVTVRRQEEEEGYDKAQVIYEALARRLKSRFARVGVSGMMFLVSSKRGVDDFTERRIKACQQTDDGTTFVRDYSSWGVRPEAYTSSTWYKMAFSQLTGRSRYLADQTDPGEGEIEVKFPEEFKGHFDLNPMGAAQDYAGISFEASDTFISNRAAIDKMMTKGRVHPFATYDWQTDQDLGIDWSKIITEDVRRELIPICCPHAPRHVHIDISKNQCATGFCLAHRCGTVPVYRLDPETHKRRVEEAPVIHVDFVLRIIAPPGGEIEHQKVRSIVHMLIEHGVNVRSVTMDRYCSTPNLQQFQRAGLKAEELSTVMKLDPYLYLRSAIYEDRVDCPEYPLLKKELKGLRPSPDGKKIEKGINISKDLADALGACVYYLANNYQDRTPLAPSKGMMGAHATQQSGFRPGGEIIWADEQEELAQMGARAKLKKSKPAPSSAWDSDNIDPYDDQDNPDQYDDDIPSMIVI